MAYNRRLYAIIYNLAGWASFVAFFAFALVLSMAATLLFPSHNPLGNIAITLLFCGMTYASWTFAWILAPDIASRFVKDDDQPDT